MKYLCSAALMLVFLNSCNPKAYFQDSTSSSYKNYKEENDSGVERLIMPYDQVEIKIVTLDQELNNILNPSFVSKDFSLAGYMVSASGTVDLPKLGKINLAGLTPEMAEDTIASIASLLVSNPYVSVQILTFRIKVLGEVARPGFISVPHQSPTILDALGLAGDITPYGNHELVKVFRTLKDEDVPIVYELDLTSIRAYEQAGYKLKPGDTIVVYPIQRKALVTLAPILSLGFSFLTVVATLLNLYIQANR